MRRLQLRDRGGRVLGHARVLGLRTLEHVDHARITEIAQLRDRLATILAARLLLEIEREAREPVDRLCEAIALGDRDRALPDVE